jgi:hypothetical protein
MWCWAQECCTFHCCVSLHNERLFLRGLQGRTERRSVLERRGTGSTMAEGDKQLVRRGRRLVVSGHAKVQVHSFEPWAVLPANPNTYTPNFMYDTVGFHGIVF